MKEASKLEKEKRFLVSHGDPSHGPNGSYKNITKWYLSGQISKQYIALSKLCSKIVSGLPTDERVELPTGLDLLKTRMNLLTSDDGSISKIFGNDLNKVGVPLTS